MSKPTTALAGVVRRLNGPSSQKAIKDREKFLRETLKQAGKSSRKSIFQ